MRQLDVEGMGSIALDQVAFLDDWEFHPEKSEPTTPRPDTTLRSRGPDMSKSCLARGYTSQYGKEIEGTSHKHTHMSCIITCSRKAYDHGIHPVS